ncbi:hypothetical protein CANARDRAFT_27630 [[Candida] arabinofermentans NRRL YB-2248]|uniref:Major facilitator superfamily (MFS) profile domain-containing protein n=1 Tax=[Candida] arabinofermentans NRRL YB-2248 TaxID=983967 RepID=A0A1E4T3T9_9ASCO|nr:hypothetical protein CANARDRAFT_27630 [[Candida] arabinofermentans NRRL YB-2248]
METEHINNRQLDHDSSVSIHMENYLQTLDMQRYNMNTSSETPSDENEIDKYDYGYSQEVDHSPINHEKQLPQQQEQSTTDDDVVTTSEQRQHDISKQKQKTSAMAMWVGLLTAVGGFLYGYDTGIINGLLEMAYVKKKFADDSIAFTAKETSLITGILSVGTFFGSLFAPVISDRFGRRLSLIGCTSILFSLGTILQLCAKDSSMLCAGRFVSGFAVGVVSAITPLYQAEASPKWIRGSVISLYQWAITWGLLVSSAITQVTHHIDDKRCYRIPIGIQLIWGVFLSVGMYLLPESPRFYVKKDKLDDAIVALSKFRRLPIEDERLVEELIEIKASHDYEMSFGKTSIFDCFKSSPSRASQGKRMVTGMLLQALQQCSGINFIFYYGINFFVRTGVSNSYMISFITYAVNVAFTIPGIYFVEILGRRKMLIMGAAGMTVSNLVIATVGVTTDSIIANYIMIAFVCLFIAFFASTWGPLVWVLVGEMYSLSVRQKAVSITAATNWMVNFAFAYCTAYLIDTGSHTAALGTRIFFIWGGMNAVGFFFAYFYVYETKGLMLEEVDELFRVCKSARKSDSFKPGELEHFLRDEEQQQEEVAHYDKPELPSAGRKEQALLETHLMDSSATPESISQDRNSSIFRGVTHTTDFSSMDSRSQHYPRNTTQQQQLRSRSSTDRTSSNVRAPPNIVNNTGQSLAPSNSIVFENILNAPNNIPPSINSSLDEELEDFMLGNQDHLNLDYYLMNNEVPRLDVPDQGQQGNEWTPASGIFRAVGASDGTSGGIPITGGDSEVSEYSYTNQEELMDFLQSLGVGPGSSVGADPNANDQEDDTSSDEDDSETEEYMHQGEIDDDDDDES